jgi:hypothetical protein
MNPILHGPSSIFRGLLFTGAALVLCSFFNTPVRASERWEVLEAIHWIENPHDTARPGPCGELGAYQFRQSTWSTYTTAPFTRAVDRQVSDDVAIKHYEWLKRGLVRHGLDPTPYNIALAWNGGLTAAVRGSVPASARDYAERVTNVALELHKTRVASNR